MKVTVFGTGYVGLVQAATLAAAGHHVMCIDINPEKIARLKQGECPIYEPGLETLLEQGQKTKHITFSTDAATGCHFADILFIAVGTPASVDGSANTSALFDVMASIGRCIDDSKIIVIKSTVPVGTGDKVEIYIGQSLQDRGLPITAEVVSNPEFLKEGAAVGDAMKPDRIIIGTDSHPAISKMTALYAPFNRNRNRILVMDRRSAELTKYAANCMLATKVSFMNELAGLAERMDADIEQVRIGIGADPRIGYQYIYPGCGYGGSCLPKDVQALVHAAREMAHDLPLLRAVAAVNKVQKQVLFKKISAFFQNGLQQKTIALWGLAFKPKTDDIREAASIDLISDLLLAGAKVQAYDPKAMDAIRNHFGDETGLHLASSKETALQDADVLAICTEWQIFRAPDFELIKNSLTYPAIFDGRNLYDPEIMKEHGLEYYAMGRHNGVKQSTSVRHAHQSRD